MRRRSLRRNDMKKGFTLIELLLSIAVVALLLLGINALLATVLEAREKNQAITTVETEGQYVMQLLTQTVRNATNVNTPAPSESSASLTLALSDAALSPTVFDVANATLQITEGATASAGLTSSRVSVSSFSVTNLSRAGTPGTVRIQMTISFVNSSNRNEYAYSKIFTASASVR